MSIPKVLCVDDELNILKSLNRVLRGQGFEVVTTNNPEEAIRMVAEETYAVVLSDHRMPEMTGTEMLTKVREICPDTIRMILTGYAEMQAAVDAINDGAVYRFLTKPWDDDNLRATLRQAVDQYGLAQENARLGALTLKQNEELKGLNENLEGKVRERTEEVTRLNKDLNKSLMGSINMLAELSEMNSSLVGSHSKRVASLCGDVGRSMELPARDLYYLVVAATLHDIGKMGIRKAVCGMDDGLFRSRQMKDDMVRHVLQGATIAQMVPNLGDVPEYIRHHHEHFDGTGYPDKLSKQDIPLISRIICVADAYDNKLNTRADYTRATPSKALRFIHENCSTMFDPEVVGAFTPCVEEEERFSIEENEIDVRISDLTPGMTLSREVRTLSGTLLLPADKELTQSHLRSIRGYQHKDPVVNRIYVYRHCEADAIQS